MREAVTGELIKLESNARGAKFEMPFQQTIDLIRDCLKIDKENRPKATKVSETFRTIASNARAEAG